MSLDQQKSTSFKEQTQRLNAALVTTAVIRMRLLTKTKHEKFINHINLLV